MINTPPDGRAEQPDDALAEQLQAEQRERHAEIAALIAAIQAERAGRDEPISASEWAARRIETLAVHHGR